MSDSGKDEIQCKTGASALGILHVRVEKSPMLSDDAACRDVKRRDAIRTREIVSETQEQSEWILDGD